MISGKVEGKESQKLMVSEKEQPARPSESKQCLQTLIRSTCGTEGDQKKQYLTPPGRSEKAYPGDDI